MSVLRLVLSAATLVTLSANGLAGQALITDTPQPRLAKPIDYSKLQPVPLPVATVPDLSAKAVDLPSALQGMPSVSIGRLPQAETRAHGSFGIPYTSTRVALGTVTASSLMRLNILSASHPYRMVGKLVKSGGWCSASVIKRGIIVTAAHCVQRFGSGAATPIPSFAFIPGHYFSSTTTQPQWEPYGTWTSRTVVRPLVWANGQDKGCGPKRENDIAVIALNMRNGKLIGDVVGQFGIAYNNYGLTRGTANGNRLTASVSSLGYPGNSDAGNIMQRADGPGYLYNDCTPQVPQMVRGSDFTAGSSGGPWVLNFKSEQAAYTGIGSAGADSAMAVTGVTSWGAASSSTYKGMGTSRFGQTSAYPLANYGTYGAGNIGSLLNSICSFKPSGSTQTYAQLGYCD
jgi:V8-like Glu-specific endopeptidase